jgi:hypothetical protein
MSQFNNKQFWDDIKKQTNENVDEQTVTIKENVRKHINKTYENYKTKLEKVTLHNEEDKTKNITKVIPTKLKIEEIKEKNENISLHLNFETDQPIENDIIFAQSKGTGLDVKKAILDYFGVKDENTNREKLGNFYFNPTNIIMQMTAKMLKGK